MLRYVLPLLAAGTFGYWYVYVASLVAPGAKFITGVAMTSVCGVLGGLVIVLVWLNPEYPKGQAAFDTVRFAVAMFGTVAALSKTRLETT